MGAARIGNAMGLLADEEMERQRQLLESYGLPLTCGEMDIAAVRNAMMSDKKVAGRAIRWVLLDGIGNAITRNDVPAAVVQQTLEALAVD